ncbi:Putative phospholipid-transporting ATPase [Arachis hypogaea]|nr:Putative phospholipid-transporting ATPase [Arachis hypogaea]
MWQFPMLYREGVENILFSWRRILSWMLNGFISSIIIFFFCTKAMEIQAFDEGGRTAGRDILGATMYTCVVWVVNLQMALAVNYFTLIQHVLIWGSIVIWYIFLLTYGAMASSFSGNAYHVFVETLAPTPCYWLLIFFVVITTLVPYFTFSALQMRFFPMYHEIVQWLRHKGKTNDPEFCAMVRQSSLRPTTVGSTARRAAKTNSLRGSFTDHR